MALIHWWPLNGDTKDYGLNPTATISGTPSYGTGGKIGGSCLNTSAQIQFTDSAFNGVRVWSICFWGYVISASVTNNWTGLFHITDGSSNIRVEVCPASYSNGSYCYSIHNNSGNAIFNSSIATSGDRYDCWAHFAMVCNGSTITTYINGNRMGSINYTGTGAITGNFRLINNHIVKKNDFRIYDHALTPKEVKEISKALILHYDFEDEEIEGTTNLLAGKTLGFGSRWETVTSYPAGYTAKDRVLKRLTSDPYFGSASTFLSNTNDPSYWAGKYLTLSCWYYRASASDPKISIGLSGNNGSTTYSGCSNVISSTDLTVVGEWTYTVITLRVKTDMSSYSSITYIYGCSGGSSSDTLYMADPQLEIKDHATPYVNGTRNGIVYDSSGYGYNGTNNGVASNDDSVIGLSSGYFEADKYIEFPSPFGGSTVPEITISLWCKLKSSTGYQFIFGAKNNPSSGAGWLALNTEGKKQWFYTGQYSPGVSGTINNNEWHLHTYTFKNGISNWYLDGVHQQTTNISANRTSLSAATTYTLGDSYTGSSWSGTPFNGYIADFRIYSTALSAADIQKEYQSMAHIDKSYNLTSRVFNEDPNWVPKTSTGTNMSGSTYGQLNGQGVFSARNIIETSSPLGYTKLEYIENTGTSSLDTGIVAMNKYFEIDLQFTSNETRQLIGIGGSGSEYWGNNKGSWEKVNNTQGKTTLERVTVCYDVSNITNLRTNTWIKGSTTKYQGSSSSEANFQTYANRTLKIFTLGGSGYNCKMKLYGVKVFDANKNLVGYLIPCKNSSGTVGMFDIINNNFCTNSGTFTAGATSSTTKFETYDSGVLVANSFNER